MRFKEKLLEFNKRGLVHAPYESDESFFQRCRQATSSPTSPCSELAKKMYDIEPDWVWMVFDNKGLRFWEGACTWNKQDLITLQLNKAFQKKKRYFGYSYEEVVAHELVHVVRGSFEEPIFEEILAYRSSPSAFRRFFAPLFRTAQESLFFMVTLALCLIATFFEHFQIIALTFLMCLLTGALLRLLWSQRTFTRAKRTLSKMVGKEKVLAVMLRLTDREIIRFAKINDKELTAYAKKMAKTQMRWQQIISAYFPSVSQ